MKRRMKTGNSFIKATLYLLFLLFCFYGAAGAQEDGVDGGGVRVMTLTPVPAFDPGEYNWDDAAKYRFQTRGTVDYIGEEHIVVDDVAVPLAPGFRPSRSLEGQYVGIRLYQNGEAHYVQRIRKPR